MAVCPIMSYGTGQVACVEKACALWNQQDEQCAFLASNGRLTDGLEQLLRAINDLKAKI